MTSTANKNLNVPAHGSYANDWDVPVNFNWDNIDEAFGGSTALSVTSLSGTQALSNTQYIAPNFVITGTLTADVNFQFPSGVGGIFSVLNNTSGAYAVQFSSAAGGGTVTIPQSSSLRTLIVLDGSATGVAIADSAAVGGSSGQVQYNNNGALAGSSNLTFDGTHLTAADFEGPIGGVTPAAGTFSAINGPIGTVTPAAAAFTTATATGATSGFGPTFIAPQSVASGNTTLTWTTYNLAASPFSLPNTAKTGIFSITLESTTGNNVQGRQSSSGLWSSGVVLLETGQNSATNATLAGGIAMVPLTSSQECDFEVQGLYSSPIYAINLVGYF